MDFRVFKEESEVSQLCEHVESIAKLTYQRGIDSGFKYDEESTTILLEGTEFYWLKDTLMAFERG